MIILSAADEGSRAYVCLCVCAKVCKLCMYVGYVCMHARVRVCMCQCVREREKERESERESERERERERERESYHAGF